MEVTQPLDHITHAVIGGSKSIDFGISNSAEFFQILSQSLYTDQRLAVVREVLCNAWDAHIASGKTNTPIKITLDSQYLTVRDYGFGIPHDDIGPIYGVYGNSTKKSDGKQTGGFGLGCKAPFAYTDHFEVTSFNNGTKSIYNMSKSNAQASGKPGIVTLVRMPTTEHGLMVKIPLVAEDYGRFSRLIERVVNNGEILADLNDKRLAYIPFSQHPHGYLLTANDVLGTASQKSIMLRYGNVIYPMEVASEYEDLYAQVIALLGRFSDYGYSYRLVLQAPPDTISVTPSREALSLQDHTIKTLKKLLSNFLKHVKGLEDEILLQATSLTDAAVAAKDYNAIFNESWCFSSKARLKGHPDITDLTEMAKFQLHKSYPKAPSFRVKDVEYRVRKAAEAKVVNPQLAASFLEKLPKLKENTQKYGHAGNSDRSDWLQRRVIGKVLVKLRDAGLDDTALFLMDKWDPSRSYGEGRLTPAREAYRRHHLINLPFLRKAVVVTTAITSVDQRLQTYNRHVPGSPQDGLLCYYVRSRKAGNAEAAIDLFTKLGYEVIDLTKRQTWEAAPDTVPRAKREPYAGLPALSNILESKRIRTQAFLRKDAVILPTPEYVLVIRRLTPDDTLDGFDASATKDIVLLYGSTVAVAKDQIEYKRAIKHGAKDFRLFLEQELLRVLLTSPTCAEYFAYECRRVLGKMDYCRTSAKQALKLVYATPELYEDYGIRNNLTDEERALINIYHQAMELSADCFNQIKTYIDRIPLAPENHSVRLAVTDNELLEVLDTSKIKYGLQGPKRQTYIDILLKALKG